MSYRTLVNGVKSRLRAQGMSYRRLAELIGVSEPTIKRDLSRGNFSLQRLQSSLRRVAAEFEQLARQDVRLPLEDRDSCTVILAMSSWEFSEFSNLRRAPRSRKDRWKARSNPQLR